MSTSKKDAQVNTKRKGRWRWQKSRCKYFYFVQLDFAQADLRFGQETQEPQSAAKKVIDVNKVVGLFSAFTEKKTTYLMQNSSSRGTSQSTAYPMQRSSPKKDIKAQVIAIIDSENLMP